MKCIVVNGNQHNANNITEIESLVKKSPEHRTVIAGQVVSNLELFSELTTNAEAIAALIKLFPEYEKLIEGLALPHQKVVPVQLIKLIDELGAENSEIVMQLIQNRLVCGFDDFITTPSEANYTSSYIAMIGSAQIIRNLEIKDDLKNFYREILELFFDTAQCINLLRGIEDSLRTMPNATPLRKLSRSSIDAIKTEYIAVPIPPGLFKPIKKNGELTKILLSKFHQYGINMSDSFPVFSDFVDKDTADAFIKNGGVFVEQTNGVSGSILHGKWTHALQLWIIIRAIADNIITLPQGYTLKEFWTSVVNRYTAYDPISKQKPEKAQQPWSLLMDTTSFIKGGAPTFRDPFYVNECIITSKLLPTLRGYLLSSMFRHMKETLEMFGCDDTDNDSYNGLLAYKLSTNPAAFDTNGIDRETIIKKYEKHDKTITYDFSPKIFYKKNNAGKKAQNSSSSNNAQPTPSSS